MSKDVMNTNENKDDEGIFIVPTNLGVAVPSSSILDSIGTINDFGKSMGAAVASINGVLKPMQDLADTVQVINTQCFGKVTVLSDIIQGTQENMASLIDAVTILPMQDLQKTLDTVTSVDINFDSFYEIASEPISGLSLVSTSRQTTDLGLIRLETEQELVLKVKRIEEKVDGIQTFLADELYTYLLEDGKKKEDMLNELLEYYRGDSTDLVRIKDIKFSQKSCKVIIDKTEIKLKPDSNQAELCKVLFKNEKAISKVWYMDEIVEELGEFPEHVPIWKPRLYQTARQISDKIARNAHLNEFLLYTMEHICINPKYLPEK